MTDPRTAPTDDASDADAATVRALLDAAGVRPSESEIQALVRVYPGLRRQIEGLYRVPAGDEAPATTLRAELGR